MILNLTQHKATPEQVAAGVVDLEGADRERLLDLLTFDLVNGNPPPWGYVLETADEIARLASRVAVNSKVDSAMIGGAPYLMGPLARALSYMGIHPLFAFSTRESVEQVQEDGSVRKINVFRHSGFVRQETV